MLWRVVLDTNVWVSAFRSRRGASRRTADLVLDGRLAMYVTAALVFEYEEVFAREHAAMHLEPGEVPRLVDLLAGVGLPRAVHYRWRWQTPNANDAHVLEAAVAAPAGTLLVTHNERDFREAPTLGVEVVTPGALLQALRRAGHL